MSSEEEIQEEEEMDATTNEKEESTTPAAITPDNSEFFSDVPFSSLDLSGKLFEYMYYI